jgi:putative transcriptional regulator
MATPPSFLPQAHLPPEALTAYAVGDAPESLALVAACHLTFCPTCRRRVEEQEERAGAALATAPRATLAAGAWERIAAALDAPPPRTTPGDHEAGGGARHVVADAGAGAEIEGWPIPRPLAEALHRPTPSSHSQGRARFRRLFRGVKSLSVPLTPTAYAAGHRARLLLFPPGYRLPAHHHHGPEHTIVLAGGFTDAHGHYGRGDVSVPPLHARHAPRVDADGPCLALVVNQGPVRPTSPWLRLWLRAARWLRRRKG